MSSYGYLSNAEGIGGRLFGLGIDRIGSCCVSTPSTGEACENSPVALDGDLSAGRVLPRLRARVEGVREHEHDAVLLRLVGSLDVCRRVAGHLREPGLDRRRMMPPVAHMDAVGVIDGVCMWNGCLDLAGADQTSGPTPNWVNPHSVTPWSASPGWAGYYGKYEATAGRAFLQEVLGRFERVLLRLRDRGGV